MKRNILLSFATLLSLALTIWVLPHCNLEVPHSVIYDIIGYVAVGSLGGFATWTICTWRDNITAQKR